MITTLVTTVLVHTTCWKCGIEFGMPSHFMKKRREDHGDFYCPNGHPAVFTGESKEEKLRKRLADESRRLKTAESERDHLMYSVRAQKAAKTRLKNRIKNGVCPCCNRSFANLKRHMDGQHPDYAKEK